MASKDILSKYFSKHYYHKNENSYFNSSYSKKKNNLRKYDLFYTENNMLKFSPTITKLTINNNVSPFNLYDKQPFTNKAIIKKINNLSRNGNPSKNNFYDKKTNNINLIHNTNDKSILYSIQNCKETNIVDTLHNNNTLSTYFSSPNNNYQNNPKTNSVYTIQSYKEKKFPKNNNISIGLKNKSKNFTQKEIDDEANKLVDYYLNTDFTKIKKKSDSQKNSKENEEKLQKEKLMKFEKEKRKRILLDTKLLNMKNIKHRLMLGNNHNFKSINIQILALGKEKNRRNMLIGIQDYLKNRTYKSIKQIKIKNEKNIDYVEDEKLSNRFEFNDTNSKIFYADNTKKRSFEKNRLNKINDSYSFATLNRPKSIINKTDYLNFYQKIDYLCNKVRNTQKYIEKKIQTRQKYKENLSNLYISSKNL